MDKAAAKAFLEAANQYGSHQWQGKMDPTQACDCGNTPPHTMSEHMVMRNSVPKAKMP